MTIEIHIPRPLTLLAAGLGILGWVLWLSETGVQEAPLQGSVLEQPAPIAPVQNSVSSTPVVTAPIGGTDIIPQEQVHQAEEEIFFARKAYVLLNRKEELLRYQLQMVEEEQRILGKRVDSKLEKDFIKARSNLVRLLQDKKMAEKNIRDALHQLWEAQVRGREVSLTATGKMAKLEWPIEPIYGISATFRDPEYEKQFGFPHQGIDIPALQGTEILSPADGVIETVSDNGLGYSYLIVRHAGIATLYGHISSFLVKEGDKVSAGTPIALTGGRPGSQGAGAHTTGPHLHMEVIKDGKRIDPASVLPKMATVE